MLPVDGPTGELQSLSRNAGAVPFTRQTIKGIEYAIFSAAAGGYTAVYAADTTAPIISDVGGRRARRRNGNDHLDNRRVLGQRRALRHVVRTRPDRQHAW